MICNLIIDQTALNVLLAAIRFRLEPKNRWNKYIWNNIKLDNSIVDYLFIQILNKNIESIVSCGKIWPYDF